MHTSKDTFTLNPIGSIAMKTQHWVVCGVALLVLAGLQSCTKSSSSALDGTWIVKNATGDTTARSEPYLGYEVWARNFKEGGSMAFEIDSIMYSVPPDNHHYRVRYSVLSKSQFVITGRTGKLDTMTYKISGDSLWLNNPSHRTSILLTRGLGG